MICMLYLDAVKLSDTMNGDLPPHGNIYVKDKKISISPLEEYPNKDQEVIPDTSEHVDEEDKEEISAVQEYR